MTSCRTYSPYGAWELKRTYQRNLLLANMCVVALVVLAVGIPSILATQVVIEVPPSGGETDTVEIVAQWNPPPEVLREWTDGPVAPPPEELVAGILTPVDDSLFPDNDPPAIASQDELAQAYDYEVDQFRRRGGGTGTDVDLGVTDFIEPDIDSFVQVDIEPKMIHEVKPDYPRQAQMTGMEGDVWVAVLVGIDGSPRTVRIRRSSEIAALDLAAEEAAWKNRFSPAIRGGEPLMTWVIYKVSFRMNE